MQPARFVLLCALSVLSLATAQDHGQCRDIAMTCVLTCMENTPCQAGDRACIKNCKTECTYTCPLTREIWTPARTEYCCACTGVRC